MNVEVIYAKYTSSKKTQFLAFIKVNGSKEEIPFYVNLKISDSSEVYKEILRQMKKNIFSIDEPDDDTEYVAEEVRSERNKLLSNTDYLVQPDYKLSKEEKKEVRDYRTELRDLTNQEGFPHNVVWPKKPDFLINKE